MANSVEISILLDLYGETLTEKQRSYLDCYYNNDLSLSEIAENEGITRQGVRDAIKRAETLLYGMEEKLHFSERIDKIEKSADEIIRCADEICDYNLSHGISKEINDRTTKIKELALSLAEQEGLYGI